MANPRPVQNEKLKAKQFKRLDGGKAPLAKGMLAIRLEADVDEVLRAMGQAERVAWMRRVLGEAARRELMPALSTAKLGATVPQPAGDAQESQLTGHNTQIPKPQDEPPAKGARRGRKRRGGIEGQSTLFEEQP